MDKSRDSLAPPPDRMTGFSLDPRKLSSVPPPPMMVVHKGWFRDRVTERPAAELIREAGDRRQDR